MLLVIYLYILGSPKTHLPKPMLYQSRCYPDILLTWRKGTYYVTLFGQNTVGDLEDVERQYILNFLSQAVDAASPRSSSVCDVNEMCQHAALSWTCNVYIL